MPGITRGREDHWTDNCSPCRIIQLSVSRFRGSNRQRPLDRFDPVQGICRRRTTEYLPALLRNRGSGTPTHRPVPSVGSRFDLDLAIAGCNAVLTIQRLDAEPNRLASAIFFLISCRTQGKSIEVSVVTFSISPVQHYRSTVIMRRPPQYSHPDQKKSIRVCPLG